MSGGQQTQPFYFDKKFVVLSDWYDLEPSLVHPGNLKFPGMARSRRVTPTIVRFLLG